MYSLQRKLRSLLALVSILAVVACGNGEDSGDRLSQKAEAEVPTHSSPLTLDVYKSPTCGCCEAWIEHLNEKGFSLSVHHPPDLEAVKATNGIQARYRSCHTAVSREGYVFEGHVPARFVRQFLEEKPAGAIGLAVPGMPIGSPGMEMGDEFAPYQVLLLKTDGSSEVYTSVETAGEQYQ